MDLQAVKSKDSYSELVKSFTELFSSIGIETEEDYRILLFVVQLILFRKFPSGGNKLQED